MSESRTIKAKCPYCGHEFDYEVWDTITADTDPDLRDRCISGDLFGAVCPHCRKRFMFQYPLIYIDQAHQFVLWLSDRDPGKDLQATTKPLADKGYTLRRCATVREFTQKIEVLEDGADDVLVELAKFDAVIDFVNNKNRKPEEISSVEYQCMENGTIVINIRTGDEGDRGWSEHFPIKMLQEEVQESDKMEEPDNASFPAVNEDWIVSIFSDPAGQA
ncbi:MAG: CpXC domain-containing protein [Solobacterium sp.]|jgi:DNA-directed RNA polymerase subunit RPC12/RpoP|nr:CpXC domain-containing protein [Solobacterium sp.]MCH4222125.1 CpXC domain-containing protein [Solobacterium sp.]MCH4265888.1 CpXC domain-containing protein [Solobacterium sp.]